MRSGRRVKRLLLSAFAASVFLLLTGCWDRLEIEERAIVLGVSVDNAPPGAAKRESEISHTAEGFPVPDVNMIRVTLQIALPGKIPLGPGESGGGGKGSEQTVWVVGTEGHTVDDAIMNLQQQISGRLFFGHLRVIVVSEDVARLGMQNINDYFHRNPEVRRMAWMMISKGSAEQVMRASPELERVPALYLMSTMDNAVKLGKFPENYVGMYWSNSAKRGQEGYLPYVELKKMQNIEVKGMAYFKDDKLQGTTKPFQVAAYMSIKGMNPAGYRGVVKIGGAADSVMIYATSRRSTIKVRVQDGEPIVNVAIFTEINLEEKINEQFTINDSASLVQIEEQNKRSLLRETEALIRQMQEKGSDIFGFGEYVRAKKPGYWNARIGSKNKWQRAFKELRVEVEVNSKIRRVGMKAK
ncbi:spore gernimation protein GerC [Cohnella sp. CIP 111063]|uniref:Ger(x)C family spore germination protein n=1 Tax=unclassified Cohnella TaxID=2636738 RepID=UPI000B8BC390|nr:MULTISPECIES: Ger(x)C family spore germination protein [unclassified Cohnella]OXS56841.1 spore gernimation protein GerC [Cohnella sp. CIP 111063]PRX69676.1 Ger(x)C family germination protein [Cohnella sp. SGD-V74]